MMKSKFNTEDAYQFYLRGRYSNKQKAVTDYCAEKGIEEKPGYRSMLSMHTRRKGAIMNEENHTKDGMKQMQANIDGYCMNIQEYCNHYNLPFEDVKKYKLVSHSGSGAFYNIEFITQTDRNYLQTFRNRLLFEMNDLVLKPVANTHTPKNNGRLLVVDIADLHIGKYASEIEVGKDGKYNMEIAVQRALEGVEGILQYSYGFNIDQILFVGGNDILHTDNTKRQTTSGTPQDTDGMWFENFLVAKDVYIRVLDRLREVAKVHYMHNPSNHDYAFGFMLSDVIKTYYKNCTDITFDSGISHRKYYKYHNNLIATTHGDGGKLETLPMTIANECEFWSECTRRYAYVHHFHHKINKDFPGITIEAVRSASGSDSWHHRNQYTGAKKSIEGFVHDKEMGQIARFSYNF